MMTLKQKHWRALGLVSLTCAAAMALYAAVSGVLRDTVVAASGLNPEEAAGAIPAGILVAYWAGFAVFIGLALGLALLDIRHIRLQYAAGKREILKRTLHEKGFRRSLRDGAGPGNELSSSRNGI